MDDEQNSKFGMGGRKFYADDEPQKPATEQPRDDEYAVSLDDLISNNTEEVDKNQDVDDPLDRLTSNEEL